jgi:hypothetical protein
MPIPKPGKTEDKNTFISRCMGDKVTNREWPDQKQRAGVCYSQWEHKKSKASIVVQAEGNEYISGDIDLTDEEIATIKKEVQG